MREEFSAEQLMAHRTLEAMAKGKPIISGAESGLCEMLESGVDGLLIQPRVPDVLAETLSQVISEPELRSGLAQAARHSAETRLSAGQPVRFLEEWYDSDYPGAYCETAGNLKRDEPAPKIYVTSPHGTCLSILKLA